jgi:predicted amidohydrolase
MKPSTASLLKAAEGHLARFAFFTRDNPFLSSRAAFRLEDRHRRALGDLLEGRAPVDEWLSSTLGKQLRGGLTIGCVPRDLQLVTTDDGPAVGVESVHAFLHGPVFWWLVSILWTIVVGRQLDPELGEDVIGYRLASKFVADHSRHGLMFQEPRGAYDRWKRYPLKVAERHPGETLGATTVDIRAFYYTVSARPSEIVAALRKRSAQPRRSRHFTVLTELLDALHSAFADEVAAAEPRAGGDLGVAPLPVGLPSSRLLANVIMFLATSELAEKSEVVGAAAYADDIVIVSRALPDVGDSSTGYLTRLGILDDAESLDASSATKLARLNVGLEKTSAALVRVVNDDTPTGEPEEPTNIDPYIEADTSPEWDGILRTILRVPYRRERMPRQIVSAIRRLVDEIRVGLDRDEAASRVGSLIDDLDSAAFLAIRPYWSDLLVAAVGSLGTASLGKLTRQFHDVVSALVPPPGANPKLTDALHFGLRTSWTHAAAQALSVASSRADRDALAMEDEILIEDGPMGELTTKSIALYATRLRSARLVAPAFVASPLSEFSDWSGPLIGDGAAEAFTEWCATRTEPQRRAMIMRWIQSAARFIHLHEACLAVHLWLAPESENWLEDVRRILRSQPLVDGKALDALLALSRGSLEGASQTHDFSDKARQFSMRFAMPCVAVPETQLDVQIGGDRREIGALAREARSVTMRIVLDAVSRHADVLVLPEWTILPELLPWVMERSSESQILLIGGQTATVRGATYTNRLWIGLPIIDGEGRRACLVPPPRAKKPLSPGEEAAMTGAGLASESTSAEHRDVPIFSWRGVTFASLICFEFADVDLRASLRGRADVVTLSALNRDWKYFEDAQDATTRDNYCLTVCVNTGRYPGTRMVRPTKSEMAIAAAIHGSEQPAVLTRVIDLEPIVAARVLRKAPLEALANEPSDDTDLVDYKPVPPWAAV